MANTGNNRFVLLNRLLSRSSTRAPEEHKPPIHGARELLEILEARQRKGWAIEYLDAIDHADETTRAAHGKDHHFVRLREVTFAEFDGKHYATLLIEYVDQDIKSFPVVHVTTLDGREIAGDEDERGATSAHVMIRLPPTGALDDGSYRCMVEHIPPITRLLVERFLNRQLRRATNEWSFSVTVPRKRKPKTTNYSYHPKLQLVADFGRKLSAADGKTLTHLTFTKRAEKQSIGRPTAIGHQDFVADLELRVGAKQAPEDPNERTTWLKKIFMRLKGLKRDYTFGTPLAG